MMLLAFCRVFVKILSFPKYDSTRLVVLKPNVFLKALNFQQTVENIIPIFKKNNFLLRHARLE